MASQYWSRVHQRAFREAQATLNLGSRVQIVIRALVVLAIILALFLWGSDDAGGDEMLVRLTIAGALIFLAPAVYAYHFIAALPELDREREAENEVLRTKLRPFLTVSLVNNGLPTKHQHGNTQRSIYTGTPQTVIRFWNEYLGVECINSSVLPLRRCEAFLIALGEDGGESELVDPIRLVWVPIGDELTHADITAGARRRLMVMQVQQNQLMLVTDAVPVSYVHFMKPSGRYRGTISITADGMAGMTVDFVAEWADPPRLTLI